MRGLPRPLPGALTVPHHFKTLAEEWAEFAATMQPEVSVEDRFAIRTAFYCGAFAAISVLLQHPANASAPLMHKLMVETRARLGETLERFKVEGRED